VRNAGQPRSFHDPVLLEETIESLNPGPGKLFFDATGWRRWHTRRLLAAGADVGLRIRIPTRYLRWLRHLAEFGSRLHLVRANFLEAPGHFTALGVGAFDGILMDLGVSSPPARHPLIGASVFKRKVPSICVWDLTLLCGLQTLVNFCA